MPPEFSYQQRKKLRTDSRYYIWDDPLLFKRGVDLIVRRCVPEGEQSKILQECHASPYGGHFAGDKIAHKILQSGFYWPSIFKDCFEWVKLCDQCQRMGNIIKRHEMPLQGILWCNFLMYGEWISWGLFQLHLKIYTYSLLWIIYQNGLRQQLVPRMMLIQLWDFYKEIFSADLGHPQL